MSELAQSEWALIFASSEATPASNAFDGDNDTTWITQAGYPHEIQIDLGRSYHLSSFVYTVKSDSGGRIGSYALYISSFVGQWGAAAASGAFTYETPTEISSFESNVFESNVFETTTPVLHEKTVPVNAIGRYLRFVAINEFDGNSQAAVAGINLVGVEETLPPDEPVLPPGYSWRDAIENEEPVIVIAMIDAIIISNYHRGAKTIENRLGKTLSQSGQPFGRPFGGVGGTIEHTLEYRKIFPPYLTYTPDHEVNMNGSSSFGTLGIANTDGLFTHFQTGETLTGKKVSIYLGAAANYITEYEKVIETQVESFAFGNNLEDFTITLKDLGPHLLNTPCQPRTYTGQGQMGGDENIEGDLKPLFIGHHNPTGVGGGIRQPKMINANRLVYQANDGPTTGTTAVYDSGAFLTRDTSFNPVIHSIFNYIPPSGQYVLDETRGLIRLGAVPNGVVTCSQLSRINFGGWASPTGPRQMIRAILNHSQIGAAIVNDATLLRLGNDDNPYRVSYEILTDITDKNVLEAIQLICEWTFSFWFFDGLGKMHFYEIVDPSWTTTIPTIHILQRDVISIDSIESIENTPVWKWVVNTVPNFYTHNESDLAGSVKNTEHGNYLVRPYRFRAESKDVHLQKANPMASSQEADTHIMRSIIPENSPFDAKHAPAERRRLITEGRRTRRIVMTLTANYLFDLTPGMILVNHYISALFGLKSGERMQVSSVRNDINNRQVIVEAIW